MKRFWDKVDKFTHPTGCWVWTGARFAGYGRIKINGRSIRAHRFAWSLANGSIPKGLCVLHKCDNPPCVRIDHLFLGTVAENNTDMHIKGRAAKGLTHGFNTHPEAWVRGDMHPARLNPQCVPRGEKNGQAKLNNLQIKEIHLLRSKGVKYKELGDKNAVSQATISNICTGKSWRHIL